MTEVGKETENEELFPEAVFGEKDYLSEVFGLEQHDIRMYSPLTLAYIGDAAYEIVIRTILVRKANMQVNKLHRHAAGLVKAEKQSAMIEILEPLFTEEEKQIYKRGRNAKSYTKAKNASTIDYRRATGFDPRAIAASRSSLVAATSRISTATSRLLPTGRMRRSCKARNNCTWVS